MKTQIDIKAKTLKLAASEAERMGCTVDEFLELAVERQIEQSRELRRFVAEQSKGASKTKALSALRRIAGAVSMAPSKGDELPA